MTGYRRYIVASAALALMCSEVSAQTYMECVDSAEYHIRKENWPAAESFTLRALKAEPGNSANWLLWSNLGEIRMQRGRHADALEAFDVALSRAPKARKVLSNRVGALIELGREDEAIADLGRILDSDSTAQWPLAMRGTLLLSHTDLDGAERDFNVLRRHHPEDPASYRGLARIAGLRGEAERAVSLYDEALKKGSDEESWFYKITILGNTGKLTEAVDALHRAMQDFPRNGNMYLLRAWLHKLSYENDSAEIARKLAIEYGADPDLVKSYLR